MRFVKWCEDHIYFSLGACLIVGAALRIYYRFLVTHNTRDEATYLIWIDKLAERSIDLEPRAHRLLVYVGVCFKRLGWSVEYSLRCFNIIASLAWLIVMYLIGKSIFGTKKAGLACMCLAGCAPYMIRISGQIMREPLYMLFFSSGVLCAIQIVRGRKIRLCAFTLSVLTAFAIWVRDEGFELIILTALAWLFRLVLQLRSKERLQDDLKELFRGAGGYLLGILLATLFFYLVFPELIIAIGQSFSFATRQIREII